MTEVEFRGSIMNEAARAMSGTDSNWAGPAISFLAGNLPRGDAGWEHISLTAYQIGCEALVALGAATEVGWGAVPREPPGLPDRLPRWDDTCIAVLGLAAQQRKISYRLPDGSVPPPKGWRVVDPPSPPPPNILPAHGAGFARADEEVWTVLSALGLVGADGRWTRQAELVLWREQPGEWAMDVTSDPRFLEAVRTAVETIPPVLLAEIGRLVTITDAEVDAHIRRHDEATEKIRRRYGPNARLAAPMTRERAVSSLNLLRRSKLDWIFFRHWRLPEGWLTGDAATGALKIFHDPLAIAMRRAVLGRLHPALPDFAHYP